MYCRITAVPGGLSPFIRKGNRNMKKRILIIALILCLAVAVGGTYAYFTTSAVTHNVVSSAGIEVELIEQQNVDGDIVPYPDGEIGIVPGISVSKIVSVRSVEQPAWIRVRCTLGVEDPSGKLKDLTAEQLADVIHLNTDTTSWELKDGWYYYKTALGDGGITKPLFTTVSFSGPGMGNEYQNCKLTVDIKVEAIQQVHNGNTYAEAYWPA